MEKTTIVVHDLNQLQKIIQEELVLYGYQCDLNHIDISGIVSFKELFKGSHFNGDISQWNTSNVTDMISTFLSCKFTENISKWDNSKVTNMKLMFYNSKFNQDIEQ